MFTGNLVKLKANKSTESALGKWRRINKYIDKLHISNHKSESCRTEYNVEKMKDIIPNVDPDTMVCEQLFSCFSRYSKIARSLPKLKFLFFFHRQSIRRNSYIERCRQHKVKPYFPPVRKRSSHKKK